MKIVFTILALSLIGSAQAQTIVAEVNGTPVATTTNGGNLVVSVGTITTNTLVRIYDSGSTDTVAPTLNLGSLTINGAAASGTLSVLIAASTTTAFPSLTQAAVYIPGGVTNFGYDASGDPLPPTTPSLSIVNPLDAEDHSLRDASVLAMAVSHNTAGSIDVGRVFRIQAFGITTSPTTVDGGFIGSPITAHTPDIASTLGSLSINVITAGTGIGDDADIMALGERDGVGRTTASASIGRVVVGPVENNIGLQGDIIADDGRIGSVFSTGPIGV